MSLNTLPDSESRIPRISSWDRARQVLSATAFAGAALLGGCATTGGNSHGQSAEVRIGVNGGRTTIEPSHYPTYRWGNELPASQNTRIAVGGLAGFAICRIAGANYLVSVGCAAIGGVIGSKTYDPTVDQRADTVFLVNQVAVLRPGSFTSKNLRQRPDLTAHISVLEEKTVGSRYYKRFKLIHVDVGGNTYETFGVISRPVWGGVFQLENFTSIPR